MTDDRLLKIPGPDHPIEIQRNASCVVVIVGGKVIADTLEALTLSEAGYAAVQYILRRDVDMTALSRSDHATYCPYKGEASYFSIPIGGERSTNARVDVRDPLPGDGGDQGLCRLLPRPRRRDPITVGR